MFADRKLPRDARLRRRRALEAIRRASSLRPRAGIISRQPGGSQSQCNSVTGGRLANVERLIRQRSRNSIVRWKSEITVNPRLFEPIARRPQEVVRAAA